MSAPDRQLEWPVMLLGDGPEDDAAQDSQLTRFCTFRHKTNARSLPSGRLSNPLSHVRMRTTHLHSRAALLCTVAAIIPREHVPSALPALAPENYEIPSCFGGATSFDTTSFSCVLSVCQAQRLNSPKFSSASKLRESRSERGEEARLNSISSGPLSSSIHSDSSTIGYRRGSTPPSQKKSAQTGMASIIAIDNRTMAVRS